MPIETCDHCHCDVVWSWTEAFDKFGFCDGDGLVMTEEVAYALRDRGYRVETRQWGLHNTVISSIRRGTVELIPHGEISFGYSDPRDYLPGEIFAILDDTLPDAS